MTRRHLIKDKEKRKRVAHIAATAAILIHAYENYEAGHHSYLLFALAGIIIFVVALFHPVLEKKLPWIDGTTFIVEGILSLIIALDLFNFGKKALSICYLLLGIFQFYMAFRKGKKGLKKHRESHQITT
jgi:uncharacterized membrane protein HdeD (DUF308 family)